MQELNGPGYTNDGGSDDSVFASKIMTTCDTFDVLAASGRPETTALSSYFACDSLPEKARAGARKGLIDAFIES
jgi:HD-GYP domain-containing protein (c-di-GMP phosphodiesterase class II)